ncbi:MAG: polyketide cyclase [Hyphomicrobiales bacterium]|nr:polyketide cyclase [Hyphomicrobiales bacterium]
MAPTTDSNTPEPTKVSRLFHAPRAVVFRAWTSAGSVSQWFGPKGFTVPEARVEPHVGGAFEVCMRAPDGQDHWTRGSFLEFSVDTRLVIDMHVPGPNGKPLFSALTRVDFSDAPGGAKVDVEQSYVFEDPAIAAEMVKGAPEGWRMTLDKLDAYVRQQGAAGRSVVHATFRLERTYDAAPARVWAALTDPVAKAKWFGGPAENWTSLERQMDVRPGGTERAKGAWTSGVVSCFDAIYHDVIENERLVYAYEMHIDDRKISVSLATMELKPADAGTRLVVTEQGAFLDGYDDAGSREHGTGFLLDMLGESLKE